MGGQAEQISPTGMRAAKEATMKSKRIVSRFLFATIIAIVLLGVTACSTFESRAREKSDVFESLPSHEQKRLERGVIRVGDTEDMVYIALGRPDEKRAVDTADGRRDVWSYRSYWQEYASTEWIGWHRSIVPGPRGFVIFHEPVTANIYRTHDEERIRVTFQNGRVVSVEQRQDT